MNARTEDKALGAGGFKVRDRVKVGKEARTLIDAAHLQSAVTHDVLSLIRSASSILFLQDGNSGGENSRAEFYSTEKDTIHSHANACS